MLEKIVKRTNLFDVFIVLIASLAIVGFWRGMWNLMDRYVFPNRFLLSQLLTITGGILILILIAEYKGGNKK